MASLNSLGRSKRAGRKSPHTNTQMLPLATSGKTSHYGAKQNCCSLASIREIKGEARSSLLSPSLSFRLWVQPGQLSKVPTAPNDIYRLADSNYCVTISISPLSSVSRPADTLTLRELNRFYLQQQARRRVRETDGESYPPPPHPCKPL